MFFFCVLAHSFASFSQETISNIEINKSRDFFNLTKISYIKAYSLRREVFRPGEGNFFSEPDAGGLGALSIQTINGFYVSPFFTLGLGFGLDSYRNPDINTIPVFLDARYYTSDKMDSLLIFSNLGAAVKFGGSNSNFDQGVLFNLGAGYRYSISDRLSLISEVYFSHKTISLTEEWIRTSDDVVTINGVGLSLGIAF